MCGLVKFVAPLSMAPWRRSYPDEHDAGQRQPAARVRKPGGALVVEVCLATFGERVPAGVWQFDKASQQVAEAVWQHVPPRSPPPVICKPGPPLGGRVPRVVPVCLFFKKSKRFPKVSSGGGNRQFAFPRALLSSFLVSHLVVHLSHSQTAPSTSCSHKREAAGLGGN